jgi:hypothetical protein
LIHSFHACLIAELPVLQVPAPDTSKLSGFTAPKIPEVTIPKFEAPKFSFDFKPPPALQASTSVPCCVIWAWWFASWHGQGLNKARDWLFTHGSHSFTKQWKTPQQREVAMCAALMLAAFCFLAGQEAGGAIH